MESIYKSAIKKFGTEKQKDMVIEECSELIKTIVKLRRYNGNETWRQKVVEETVDVTIMLEQLKLMVTTKEEFEEVHNYKLNNLKKLLEKDDPNRGVVAPATSTSKCSAFEGGLKK